MWLYMEVCEQAAGGCGRVARRMSGWLLAPSLVDTASRGLDMVDHLRVLEMSAPAHAGGREGEAPQGLLNFLNLTT